ncbi:hypothetical protein D3C72_2322950 [compost metagenome]
MNNLPFTNSSATINGFTPEIFMTDGKIGSEKDIHRLFMIPSIKEHAMDFGNY